MKVVAWFLCRNRGASPGEDTPETTRPKQKKGEPAEARPSSALGVLLKHEDDRAKVEAKAGALAARPR
jgi:hypothetical protein